MVAILLLAVLFQVLAVQLQSRGNAEATFLQVKQIIKSNDKELDELKAEYRETCLLNAEAISYIIDKDPDILIATETSEQGKPIVDGGRIEQFRTIAKKLAVDEIHIFDESGRIYAGTHKEYFDFTFESGEQIGFFKPLLTDKSKRLCQDITPNTAEGKQVQYSALWGTTGTYIVQVGMYPDAVLAATEKNELSYIFSLLRGNPGVSLYAVSSTTGKIIGSPAGMYNDEALDSIGLNLAAMKKYEKGMHVKVNGVNSYCVFEDVGGTLIGYVIANDQLYGNLLSFTLTLAACLLLIALLLVFFMLKYTDRYILNSISLTNDKLRAVTEGNLDEEVDVRTSVEFAELSNHINTMIQTLLADTDKMSLVLNRTNLHVGVYEYNVKMKNVRFTDHIPEIFGLTVKEMRDLSRDYHRLQVFIDRLRSEPVDDAENTYRVAGKRERYIKLEELTIENGVLGIVMDVTEETVSRKRAEVERDFDLLTGLYNRRGMERQLATLFGRQEGLGYGAIVMLDCDNLKHVNDTYGHAAGDDYLKQVADLLRRVDAPCRLVARVGGDEFVLFVCGYSSNAEVQESLLQLQMYQSNASVELADGSMIPLLFSYGYELMDGRADYQVMLTKADANMYESKRLRKKGGQS